MKYLIFSTLIAAQIWLGQFETRLNTDMGSHYGTPPGYCYSIPISLASEQAAIAILPDVEQYLVTSESSVLVDDIASLLPPLPTP